MKDNGVFNLRKHSQQNQLVAPLNNVVQEVDSSLPSNPSLGDRPEFSQKTKEQITENLNTDQKEVVQNIAEAEAYQAIIDQIKKMGNEVLAKLDTFPEFQELQRRARNLNQENATQSRTIKGLTPEDMLAQGLDMATALDYEQLTQAVFNRATSIQKKLEEQRLVKNPLNRQQQFNMAQVRRAQQQLPPTSDMNMQLFPVENAADLSAKLFPLLVTNDPDTYASATEAVIAAIRGQLQEEEINSMLETLRQLDPDNPDDQTRALSIFGQMFQLLPANLKRQSEKQAMNSPNPKGIIKYDLSNHIVNNQETMLKTAADQFGQQYLLYGPTEKRICPKLSGKLGGYQGSGNVVSEYICRHHCLDGIVIDDNKTICGEALWRANVMDKQSREYVDENGTPRGGYIEGRFLVDHNVPEETKMRLKPGETRKPRPVSIYGNMEARLQDMRQKEGKQRGYRPDTNTGDTFNWTSDVDQNNVEVSQQERDRREKAMGHETVQYTNREQGENKPKTAQATYKNCPKCGNRMVLTGSTYQCQKCKTREIASSKFNLNNIKMAQLAPIPVPQDGASTDRFLEDPKQRAKSMRSVGNPASKELQPPPTEMATPEPPMPSGPVVNQVGDSRTHDAEQKKQLGAKMMEFNPGGTQNPIYQVASTWYSGKDTDDAQALQEAYDLILADNDPQREQSKSAVLNALSRFLRVEEPKSLLAKVKNDDIKKIIPKSCKCTFNMKSIKEAKSPPGWSGTVEQMKDHEELDNPFALAWWMKNKGYKSHYNEKGNKKDAQMTGPRGPFGPDNPQSDDLGLSPDYDPRDDVELEDRLYQKREPSPLVEQFISDILHTYETQGIQAAVAMFQQEQRNPENTAVMNQHDWDDVVNGVIAEISQLVSPEETEIVQDAFSSRPEEQGRLASQDSKKKS